MPYNDQYFNKQRPAHTPMPKATTPKKPRARLKPVSKKRAKVNRKVNPERKAFLMSVGYCMACFESRFVLDCHEITRGPAREAALEQPGLWLCLCRRCHDGNVPNWPIAHQLAMRFAWDIKERCRVANHIRGRGPYAVTPDDVMAYLVDLA